MALYHFHVEQIKRCEGRTAVASAAYRAGEKLHNLWDGETHDYTKKGGVIYKEIMLPDHAPKRFLDRYTLWNEVEQVEKRYDAQLSYSFDMALQNEFSMEENIALAREFVQKYFVFDGMIADFAVHQPDKEEGGIPNPHFHVLVPIRPLNADGTWGQSSTEFIIWTKMETESKTKTESGCLMQSRPQTGADRKRWICGVKPGRIWLMPYLKKKDWNAALIIALMWTRAWI